MVHALLYLVISLLAVALIVFYVLGAPFAAALEVIVYAGAIMVLFVFVIMHAQSRSEAAIHQERRWLTPWIWVGPIGLSAILLGELVYLLWRRSGARHERRPGRATASGQRCSFGPYLLGVELASMLLLAGLVGAYHLGRRTGKRPTNGRRSDERRPMQHALLLAMVLFALGLIGVLMRRNLIFMLMSIEIMLNAAGLAFVVAGARWGQADGQIMFIFILTMAAAEVAVGLTLVLQLYQRLGTLDADAASQMRG